MKIIRVLAAAMLAVLFSVTLTSCKEEKSKSVRSSKDTEIEETEFSLDDTKYYVMVGTAGSGNQDVRLRYFDGEDIKAVVWSHSAKDIEYGDIFVDESGTEPVRVESNDVSISPPYRLDSKVELKKIGNCIDIMETLKLEVTSADYDGMGHWSIHLIDEEDTEYYYGFVNDAFFTVDMTSSAKGDEYIFAMNDGKLVIPLETSKPNP